MYCHAGSIPTVSLKTQMLGLVAAHVFQCGDVSRLFGISRNTFYKYCHQPSRAVWHPLIDSPCHGSANLNLSLMPCCVPRHNTELRQAALANLLYHQGVLISPNTVRVSCATEAPSVPPVPCRTR